MKEHTILGRIDCPHCGYVDGMRITPDKNGAPFGYCDANCAGQLRVGGDKRRVDAFYAKYPNVKRGDQVAAPAPAAAAPKPAPAPAKPAPAAKAPPAPAPTPAPAPKRGSGIDWLLSGGRP